MHEVNQTAQVMPSGTLDPPSAEMPFLKGAAHVWKEMGARRTSYSQIFDDEDLRAWHVALIGR
jgi:hypothetical protein